MSKFIKEALVKALANAPKKRETYPLIVMVGLLIFSGFFALQTSADEFAKESALKPEAKETVLETAKPMELTDLKEPVDSIKEEIKDEVILEKPVEPIGSSAGTAQIQPNDQLAVEENPNAPTDLYSNPLGEETQEDGTMIKTVSSCLSSDDQDNVDYSGADRSWHDTSYIEMSGNFYAYANLNDDDSSEYLKATDFDFSIPTTATILGITVNVERKVNHGTNCVWHDGYFDFWHHWHAGYQTCDYSPIKDYRMRLVKDGTIGSTDRSTATEYTTTDVTESHGGPTDLWGTGWTPADINDHDFGMAFAAYKDGNIGGDSLSAMVDYVCIEVNYNNNTSPDAVNDVYTLDEDTYVVMDVLTNDTDPESDMLSVTSVTQPSHGVSVVNGDNTISYGSITPDYFGADSFTYTISDGHGGTDTATVNLTINPVNDAPVAADGSDDTDEDTLVHITLPASDVETNWASLSYYIVSYPEYGTLISEPVKSLGGSAQWGYNPSEDFNGTDSFTFKAFDGDLDSNVATFTITVNPVNDNPVAVDDIPVYTLPEDSTSGLEVLGNDYDVDGDRLTIIDATSMTDATLWIIHQDAPASDYMNYRPAENFYGADSFTYTISDGNGGTATATMYLTITPVNDAPAAADEMVDVNEDMTKTILFNPLVTDPEGNPWHLVNISNPAHGILMPVTDRPHQKTYIPDANYYGPDSFTYQAQENGFGGLTGNTATIYINVRPINDASPVAVADNYVTGKNITLNIPANGILANDTDVDNDAFTATLAINNPGPSHGSLTLNADGSFVYTPDTDYVGTDKFFYRAYDGYPHSYSTRTQVTINVNDSPVANDDAHSVNKGAVLTVLIPGVLGNDTDPEGDPLSVLMVATSTNGSIILDGNGSFVYTPNADYFGTDSFTYQANDGYNNSNIATVLITVNDVVEPVVVNGGSGVFFGPIVLAPQVLGEQEYADCTEMGDYPSGTLMAQENIKEATVYYIGVDCKKYIFPDAKTYFTWYSNWDSVVKVSVSTLDDYADANEVITYRPGTKFITHINTNHVYAVRPQGVLDLIPSMEVGTSLFGTNWVDKIHDVIPYFFSTSYSVSGEVLSNVLPAGTLAQEEGSDTIYYIENGAKRAFENDAFAANGLWNSSVITADLSGYTDGTAITGFENNIADVLEGRDY